ncbi:hypothetical protein QJQ45_011925 [Haematococcus lacustris]|nr:hypothetical protein QJQ45_011925 [Haematococcus lacustris]
MMLHAGVGPVSCGAVSPRTTRRATKLQRCAVGAAQHEYPAGHLSQSYSRRCGQAASRPALCHAADTQQPAVDSRSSGRMSYRPASFSVIVEDAVQCVADGIKNGLTRMEVEFPPVPVRLDGYKGASDVFIDANVQLALAGARKLAAAGRRVHVVMPDQGEYDRTFKMFKDAITNLGAGVSLGHLKEEGGVGFSFQGIFAGYGPESKPLARWLLQAQGLAADTYLIINATCVELLNVRQYVNSMAAKDPAKVFVLWNMELDTLRGDLGLPAFPPKEVHYAFLSAFRPVYFLRTRDYSKSVNVAPFIVNYSGALFREYPGPWQGCEAVLACWLQIMLKQDNGEYACIAEDRTRYNLGELKEELQAAMGLNTEEEGSALQVGRYSVKAKQGNRAVVEA